METKRNWWKITAIIFIVLFSLAFISAWWNNERAESYSESINSIYEDYESKCANNYYRECIPNDRECVQYYKASQRAVICANDEYASCYDSDTQTSVVCNKLDNVDAGCFPRGAVWAEKGSSCLKCPTGATVSCQDYSTGKWVSSI